MRQQHIGKQFLLTTSRLETEQPLALLSDTLAIPVGIRLMRDREPFQIKKFVICHNLFLFSLSLYMAIETFRQAYINMGWGTRGFTFYGNVADPLSPDGGKTFSKSGRALANVLYIHYLSKVRVLYVSLAFSMCL